MRFLSSPRSLAASALGLCSLLSSVSAFYDASAKTNLAMYWGQGPGQLDLVHYCREASVDIIPIGFVNVFPAQGNGYPGTNFGNKCWAGDYLGPGYNGVNDPSKNQLKTQCPSLNTDIPACQKTYGKKIVLSLGGGTNDYQLTGAADGIAFADFLWGAFGPRTAAWVNAGKPRPFDGPNGEEVQVDGFDMDIEYPATDGQAGYIALINRLRSLFLLGNKQYLITGAPQCVVPDANMAAMIRATQFDAIFVQFYNTAFCSARNYIQSNGVNSGFSYTQWADFLKGTASANAKLYIGLPASPAAAGSSSYFLSPAEAKKLIEPFFCQANFGGVMLWEATRAEFQIDNGATYYDNIKRVLNEVAANANLPCVAGTSTSTIGTSSTSSILPSSTSLPLSTNGQCGYLNGKTCGRSCCSPYGWCGNGIEYCGNQCQVLFGACNSSPVPTTSARPTSTSSKTPTPTPTLTPPKPISKDGRCGYINGAQCGQVPGLGIYSCCSIYGWCGQGPSYCAPGFCQSGYGGICGP